MKQILGTITLALVATAISMATFLYTAGSKDAVSPDLALTDQ